MKNYFTRSAFFPILIAGMLFNAAPFARAQELPKQDSGSVKQTTVSDKDLRAFAKAYVEYQKIREIYEPRIDKAQGANEKQRIQREGDSKVKEALEKQRLSAQAYNQIFTAINGNDQLKEKALKLIKEELNEE